MSEFLQNGLKAERFLADAGDFLRNLQHLVDVVLCQVCYVPFTRHPVLEPSFLYGGYPCKELRHKFLMAQESDAQELTKECLPEGFEIIPLPGHFFDMVGFRTPDDVVYLADCLSSRETLDKYQIGFIYDVAAYLKTLEMVKSLQAKVFSILFSNRPFSLPISFSHAR